MDIRRFFQVSHFAWIHSKDISKEEGKGFGFRLRIFKDMIYCFLKYRMWTNQYIKESFWAKNKEERELLGARFKEDGIKRDTWQKDFRENRKFLIKYCDIKYEGVPLRYKRNRKYAERYHAGHNFVVEYDVHLSRQHYLDGSIKIGDNVILAKHVTIDYSGNITIGNNVSIADGVIIESHSHSDYLINGIKKAEQTSLVIGDGVTIGTKAVILETCNKIGRYAKIGAGAVVRHDIPPYALVVGNPAQIVGFRLTPNLVVEFEEDHYPENERLSLVELNNNYNKYFISRIKEIQQIMKS